MPEPPFLAAAFTAAGPTTGFDAAPVEDGGGDDGAPKPEDGAVVVVDESPLGQGFEPEPLPAFEHCCDGALVAVVEPVEPVVPVEPVEPVVPEPVEPVVPVVPVVPDEPVPFWDLGHLLDEFLPEPDFAFFFLAVVVVAGPDDADDAAARWISKRGTAEPPATAGATKANAVTTTVAAASPSRPMRMRDIGTSLFHSGDGTLEPACPGRRRRRARHRAVRNFSAEKGLPAQAGTKYLKPV